MKEYKYRINGNLYTVKVGDIDNNLAKVEVNGVPYKVELEKTDKPVTIVTKPRPSAAPRTESGAKVIAKPLNEPSPRLCLQAVSRSRLPSPAW